MENWPRNATQRLSPWSHHVRYLQRVITNPLRKILSANIKAYREAEGVSQEAFADLCGLHRTYIGSVERGERNVTLETLQQLSDAMGVSAADLLTAPTRKGAKL